MAIPGAVRIESETAAVDYLSDLVARAYGERSSSVLEAGCGDRCALDYGPTAIVTGVDVAPELLARNPRLDHRIVADLASADLGRASFDTVVCWDVLEHLGNAESALDRLERALADPGTLILKAPNLRSPKGIVTKYTPYAFHKWVYRRFSASDATPFPTHFNRVIAPHELLRWATARQLRLRWAAYWESDLQQRLRRRVHLDGGAWNIVAGSVRRLSAGRLDASATDFVLAFERLAP